MKPHHLHAAPTGGGKRGSVSFDIGKSVRVRMDGGTDKEKVAFVYRLCFLWNMHEGIPIDVLESGAVRKLFDEVQSLIDKVMCLPKTAKYSSYRKQAEAASKAWDALKIDYMKDGRRANCSCSEREP